MARPVASDYFDGGGGSRSRAIDSGYNGRDGGTENTPTTTRHSSSANNNDDDDDDSSCTPARGRGG